MLQKWILAIAAIIPISVFAATDYRPNFDPSQLKGPEFKVPNDVLVLGTAHLREWPEKFDPKLLEPLLTRLATWKPQIITVEAISGPQCDFMRHNNDRYKDTVETYCWDPAHAQQLTGLDVYAASNEADRVLASWPAAPTPAQRRHLAVIFLASGDRASALVQWLHLAPVERRSGDGLDENLAEQLRVLTTKRGEIYLIAAPLAVRLGLERVYPIDDHTADMNVVDEKGYGEAIRKVWDNSTNVKRHARDVALESQLGTSEGVLALYREYNQPDQAQMAYEGDFGAALTDRSPQQFGRNYVGYWETRNLRMAANMRDLVGATPGKRLLLIVGASHKGYIEAYLNMMHDVRLVSSDVILH